MSTPPAWKAFGNPFGLQSDPAATNTTSNWSLISLLKGILAGGASGSSTVTQKWGTPSAVFAFTDPAAVAPTLKALAIGALLLSSEFDNTTTLYQWMEFELLVKGAVAFTAGSTVDFWIVPATDGINYSDGSASITPSRPPDGYFSLRAVNTAQRLVPMGMNPVNVPPFKFKVLIRNSGGQAFSNVDAENQLRGWAH